MSRTIALPQRSTTQRLLVVVLEDGQRVRLDRTMTLGTSELCDIVLQDKTVSRRHAVVSPSLFGVRVEDQDSRNGTFVSDVRVVVADVPPGGNIRLGTSTIRVEESEKLQGPSVPASRDRLGRFIGSSSVLQPMYDLLSKAIPTDATILVEGESGTGKELLCEAVHREGPRSNGPFVVVDCGSIQESLIESALFGHLEGAFSGATSTHIGALERADGGTVFLDELGELPLAMQTRLLRFLDRKEVRPVGSSIARTVNVRVVAATNRNLEMEVENGDFRLDLFYRLAVIYVRVPSLEARPTDIPRLCRYFVAEMGGDTATLSDALLTRLSERAWPGNVRELRNYLERWLLFGEGPISTARIEDPATADLPYRQARTKALELFTQRYVETMLDRHEGNVSRAADAAGIGRRYFQRLKSSGD